MNRKEALQVLAILKASYPNHYRNLTQEDATGIVSVWALQFANVPADIVLMALNKAIDNCNYPPSIAEVKKKLESVHWEAYEIIERHYKHKNLSAEELATYKRIYEETQRFKFGKGIEPSISDMLPKREVKQIERSKGYG